MHIAILLFDDVDLLDAGGPYEVLLTANRLAARAGDEPPFDIDTITIDGGSVVAYGGLGLTPSAAGEVLDRTDLLLVPGAVDLSDVRANADLSAAIDRVAERDETTLASVCTGSILLGDAGLRDGLPWTTHWEDVDDLATVVGTDGATRGVRWVDAGRVITGGALSSGIAMALHLVARFASHDLAERTARQIDYVWTEESAVG